MTTPIEHAQAAGAALGSSTWDVTFEVLKIVGAGAAILVALASAAAAIWKWAQWVKDVNTDRDSADTFHGKVNKFIDDFGNLLSEMRALVRVLAPDKAPVSTGSPLRLTDLGEEMSASLEADKWASVASRELVSKAPLSGSEYDVQAFAFDYVRTNEFPGSKALEAKIKRCAYNNGLPVSQVLDVLGVELRDSLLALRAAATTAKAPSVAESPDPVA